MYKPYTGVGSRETPEDIQNVMTNLAMKLSWSGGYTLRSGGADGADYAFWRGACQAYSEVMAEIYIPWNGFNNCGTPNPNIIVAKYLSNWKEAEYIAQGIHPAWDKLSRGAKALHTRNIYQVLGKDLDSPSKFLVCYAKETKDGNISGGTRTAYVLAKEYNIPCFNLIREDHLKRVQECLKEK